MGQYQSTELKQYNPEAIARYFRYRPWLVWGRLLSIIWSFAGFVFSLKWDEWQEQVEENQGQRAIELRNLLTRLGPTFIKVGQALSTRPDLIRKDFLAELVKLQDQLPPFDNALAYQIIETELDRSIGEIFRDLSPQPVAAASLGQVYHGH
ncbi:MAG: AarF/UbiB family protein, partial [Dolichospermum sp.]